MTINDNLNKFLQSAGITTEVCKWNDPVQVGTKISFSDFLREEEMIIRLLGFNETVYQKYRPLILEFLSDPEREIVPYVEFDFPEVKNVAKAEKKYNNNSINNSNMYLLNEEKLKKTINNNPIWIWFDNKGIAYVHYETIDPKFEDAFLEDIEKEIGESNPTPKEIFEKTVIVIEKRLEYNYEKAGLAYEDGKIIEIRREDNESRKIFPSGTECYIYGKGVCEDYARILEEAWRILKEQPKYSENLKGIDIYSIHGKATISPYTRVQEPEHAFNVMVSNDQITFVDVTWDDDNIPMDDLNAVDKFHICSVKRGS